MPCVALGCYGNYNNVHLYINVLIKSTFTFIHTNPPSPSFHFLGHEDACQVLLYKLGI